MRTIILVICMFGLSFTSCGQKAIKDSTGNYTAVSVKKAKQSDVPLGKTFTDSKGNKYPVYRTSTGRTVYYRVSKNTGIPYKVYLD